MLMFTNDDSMAFLFELVMLNVIFKIAIGLFLTFNGYGFSVVTPPISIFFAALDILLVIGTVFLVDKIYNKRIRLLVFHFLVVGSIVFLYANFVVYEYFRSFINFGLISFNGAGVGELMSYLATDIRSQLLLLSFVAVSVSMIFIKKKLGSILLKKQVVVGIAIPISLIIFLFLATLGRAETGKLVRNPTVDLVRSVFNEIVVNEKIDVKGFKPPRNLLYGAPGVVTPVSKTEDLKVENVLVIMIESLSLEMTSIINPNETSFEIIEKFKDRAILFDSYRTVFPATSRSFIATSCGTLPGTAHETISNYMGDFKCNSMPTAFKKNGFKTGFFASSMFTYDNMKSSDFVNGYDVFKDYLDLKGQYDRDGKFYSCQIEDKSTAKEALSFMKKNASQEKRSFTFLFMYSTHFPYESPYRKDLKKGSKESYRKAQKYVSDTIESLVNNMEKEGLLENTAVVITADHGEAFRKRPGVNGHGSSLNEEAIKIPLMILLPGLKKGVVSHRNGTHVDLAPTLADLAGIKRESSWQGINLLDENEKEKPSFVFTRSSKKLNGIVDGNYKYISNIVEGQERLYNLKTDPDELKDISSQNPEKVAEYRALSQKWAAFQQKWITSKD